MPKNDNYALAHYEYLLFENNSGKEQTVVELYDITVIVISHNTYQ